MAVERGIEEAIDMIMTVSVASLAILILTIATRYVDLHNARAMDLEANRDYVDIHEIINDTNLTTYDMYSFILDHRDDYSFLIDVEGTIIFDSDIAGDYNVLLNAENKELLFGEVEYIITVTPQMYSEDSEEIERIIFTLD